jgi:ribosomal protein L40E
MKDLLRRIPRRRRRSGAVRTDGSTMPVAGVDPATAASPSFRDRGRLRRRLRYLRRVRELGFRDLGGLVFDQHRFNRPNEELVRAKLAALQAVDAELRALEVLLDDPRPIHELREPGVAACMRCGALHGTDARFCPSCGIQIGGPRAVGEVSAAAQTAAPATETPIPPVPAAPAPAEQPTEVVKPADS